MGIQRSMISCGFLSRGSGRENFRLSFFISLRTFSLQMASGSTDFKFLTIEKFAADVLKSTGEHLSEPLRCLLSSAKKMQIQRDEKKEGPPSDAEMRRFIFHRLFDFLSREKGVGGGASLLYPDELLDAIRAMYPDGIKNYPPKAGKRKRFYEVSLEELVREYRRPPSPEF